LDLTFVLKTRGHTEANVKSTALEANPFNPETPRWHLLKAGESHPPGQNMQQNQDLTNLTA
jgi:hypothetical protein